ncbi:uncharacterized protein V6R79_019842 [Siganus canaliculatus]
MHPIIQALLIHLLAFYSLPSPPPSVAGTHLCPHQCSCYEHADLVDCRDRGFEHVPRGLPHGTWLLELGGNNLSHIGTRVFTGLWSLRVLVLTESRIQEIQPQELRLEHNSLRHISGSSLENLDNIEKLDLSHNQLVSVGPGVFKGLSRLRQLYLNNNRLAVVQQGSLDMLPGLEMLQLSNNNISQIDTDALAPLYSLTFLALEGNNLQHLKFKTFISLHTTATHIQLSGNPWSCDCDLHRVFSKILHVRHLHIDDYRNVTCHEPPQLAKASLAWVDSRLCIAETATVLVITGTVLVTVVAALVMAERNRKRNPGKNWDSESQSQTQTFRVYSVDVVTAAGLCLLDPEIPGGTPHRLHAFSRRMSATKIFRVLAIEAMLCVCLVLGGPVKLVSRRTVAAQGECICVHVHIVYSVCIFMLTALLLQYFQDSVFLI